MIKEIKINQEESYDINIITLKNKKTFGLTCAPGIIIKFYIIKKYFF